MAAPPREGRPHPSSRRRPRPLRPAVCPAAPPSPLPLSLISGPARSAVFLVWRLGRNGFEAPPRRSVWPFRFSAHVLWERGAVCEGWAPEVSRWTLLFLLTCLFLSCTDQCREPFGHLELHLGTPFLGGSFEWGLARPFHGRTGRKVGFPEEGSGDSYRSPVRWEVTRGGLSLPSAGHNPLGRCPITGSFWVRPKSRRCISHATVFVSRCCDR